MDWSEKNKNLTKCVAFAEFYNIKTKKVLEKIKHF